MKIALYGLSGSGKNYLVDRLTKYFGQNLLHINGSDTLNKLAECFFSKSLKDTDESEKKYLRIAFCENIKQSNSNSQNIVVDGHYSFLRKGEPDTVFTDHDRDAYDIFFYLDTPANKIIEYANKAAVKKDIASMSEKEIDDWKDFEIRSLKKICIGLQKELIVLDNNIEDTTDYFEELLFRKRGMTLDSAEIAEKMMLEYNDAIKNHNKIILLDCDRTISENDTTYDFCEFIGIEKKLLKEIFAGERYSMYQFFRAAKLYTKKKDDIYEKASDYAAGKAILNRPLIDDINCCIGEHLTIGITSGIFETWRKIQLWHGFPDILIGGNDLNKDKFLVSASVKYYLARRLREKGKHLTAVGDSTVDIDMLEEADRGFIIAQEKLNLGVKQYFCMEKTKISQPEYSKFLYSEIATQKGVCV
jgi:hydroxymethylpyrimidine pyrophosphatase-like HAD family hydrolase